MLLEIKEISKIYRRGKVKANDNISLSVEKGEVFGLLGPNGAGKTTLVNQIIGLAKPTSGSIHINGVDAIANPGYARQMCSFQAQAQAPIIGLTPPQAIELAGRIHGGKKSDVQRRTRELIDLLQLDEWNKTIGMDATGGVRRLVSFCMTVVVPGDIVILDEPTNDIDPLRRRLLWQEVRSASEKGSAVLLVTHNVLEAERVVDRLALIDNGQVMGMGTPAELKTEDNGSMRLEMILEPGKKIPELPGFLLNTISSNRRIISRIEQANVPSALELARDLKDTRVIEEFSLSPTTLEDVYVKIVGHLEEDEPAGVSN